MPYKILFNYASKSRPELFFRGLDSIVNNISDKKNYHILCVFDVDDYTMTDKNVLERIKKYKNLSYHFGISYSKINAINRDIALAPEWDILVNFSDDQLFVMDGFDNLIRGNMSMACEDLDMFLHYPDGKVDERLPVMSVMGKTYFDRFGYIYHPDYSSLWADNEAMEVAKKLNKHKYIPEYIFQHLHPAFGLAKKDAQYVYTESFYNADHKVYISRKKNNFGL